MAYPNVAKNEVRTNLTDTVVNAFKFAVGAAGAVGTLTQDSAGFVTSVTRAAEGRYTVQLAKPYPASILFVATEISLSSADAASIRCSFKEGSYSATTGQFEINVADVDQLSGNVETIAYSAVDPENPSTVMVLMATKD